MARQNRKFIPRQRSTRPIGQSLSDNQAPSVPHSPPVAIDGHWYIEAPLSVRLHQKSGLGLRMDDDSIRVNGEEILFCHWQRHVPLPSTDWFGSAVRSDSDLIARSIIFDVARSGGELVIPLSHVPQDRQLNQVRNTWALRWDRGQVFTKEEPVAHVRWAWTTDEINWEELLQWTRTVQSLGRAAELFVIDEEMDVTMYLLNQEVPTGRQDLWDSFTSEHRAELARLWGLKISRGTGWYIPCQIWPWESIGVEHLSGRHLRYEEGVFLESLLESKAIPSSLRLYDYLMGLGLLLRPGFKYGCRWRAYDGSVGEAHAPWLIQPHHAAPQTWDAACLAVRLAEGVHKQWLCAIQSDDSWFCLQMKRWQPGR
ncbi:MAG: hypothetical protein CMA63_05895 [Euryarchaeota archaeon]|nr:hypothetical protein [Euryarchaeota archaeon]